MSSKCLCGFDGSDDQDFVMSFQYQKCFASNIRSHGSPEESSIEMSQEVSDRRSVVCNCGLGNSTRSLHQSSYRGSASDDDESDRFHQKVIPISTRIPIEQADSPLRISTETLPIRNQRGKALSKLTKAIKNLLESGKLLDSRHALEYSRYLKLENRQKYLELGGQVIKQEELKQKVQKNRCNLTRNIRNILAAIFQAHAQGKQVEDLEGKLSRLKKNSNKIEDVQETLNEEFGYCREWLIELVDPGQRFFWLVMELKQEYKQPVIRMLMLDSIEILQIMLKSETVLCNTWIASKLGTRADFTKVILELKSGRMTIQMAYDIVACKYSECEQEVRINNISHFQKRLIVQLLNGLEAETEDDELRHHISATLLAAKKSKAANKRTNKKMLQRLAIRKALSQKYRENDELLFAEILSFSKTSVQMIFTLAGKFNEIKSGLIKLD